MKEIIVTNDNKNQRLDKFLLKYLNEAPKGFVYKMLRKKNIKLNGRKAAGDEILNENDIINIYMTDGTVSKFSSEKQLNISTESINIIYEDRYILAINKPRGVLTHPDSPNQTDTMLNRALGYLYENNAFDISSESVFTPAFCNRLDMNTTGVLVCGKTLGALQQLNKVISQRDSIKTYSALVIGELREKGILKGRMEKDGESNISAVSEYGKEVVTEYEPIMVKNGYSLVKLRLITGRSHQIRVHMSDIGHPVLGDKKYGGFIPSGPKFQMLHAESLRFGALEGELAYLNNIELKADLPADFIKWRKKLMG